LRPACRKCLDIGGLYCLRFQRYAQVQFQLFFDFEPVAIYDGVQGSVLIALLFTYMHMHTVVLATCE
jgi:hypothetical protein